MKTFTLFLSVLFALASSNLKAQTCQTTLTITSNAQGTIYGTASVNSGFATYITVDFGDGTVGTTGNQFGHTYQNNGTYIVCASHTDSLTGCYSSMCDTVVITGTIPPSSSCPASFTNVVNANGVITINNTSILDSGSTISYVNWQVGSDPAFQNTSSQFTYTTLGIGYYSVWMYMQTSSGCHSQFSNTIFVDTDSAGNNGYCYAGFYSFINSWGTGEAQFVCQGYLDSLNVDYFWDFGDGTTLGGSPQDNHPRPTHNYAQSGTYNVCLYTFNHLLNCGDTVCQTITITVTPPPACTNSFNAVTSSLNPPTIQFNNLSTGVPPFTYSYYYGDSTSGTSDVHIYSDTTYHWACVTMTDSVGCQVNSCDVIHWPYPNSCQASFQMFPDTSVNAPPGTWYAYDNSFSSFGTPIYNWDFGDGTTSTIPHPNHTYAVLGQYTVCLFLQDNGCTSYYCDSSSVHRISSSSLMKTFTVLSGPTAIKNVILERITISPNPSNGNAYLNVSGVANSSLKVYDMLGNLISTNKAANANYQLDISELNAGTYILTISNNNNVTNKKFVVTK